MHDPGICPDTMFIAAPFLSSAFQFNDVVIFESRHFRIRNFFSVLIKRILSSFLAFFFKSNVYRLQKQIKSTALSIQSLFESKTSFDKRLLFRRHGDV